MSDNVPKDLCEQQMKNAYLDIPAEVWTDIFKLLPRRTLVQRVQPVNKVFKAICDRNVKSIHIIGDISDFIWKLGFKELMVAQPQLEALAGNDCALANHFRMTNFRIQHYGWNEAKLTVLGHSLDLFRHCQLIIFLQDSSRSPEGLAESSQAYLAILEPAKPSYIEMKLNMAWLYNEFIQNRLSELLRRPTALNCPRLKLSGFDVWDNRDAIFNWLHHRVDMEEHGEEMRCLNFSSYLTFSQWLVEQCVQNFEQSKVQEDRRCFVLTIDIELRYREDELANFERKNPATGEVLLLERVLWENGQPSRYCRLLRCLAHRVTNNGKEQLYAKLFKSIDEFNLERAGDVAKVEMI